MSTSSPPKSVKLQTSLEPISTPSMRCWNPVPLEASGLSHPTCVFSRFCPSIVTLRGSKNIKQRSHNIQTRLPNRLKLTADQTILPINHYKSPYLSLNLRIIQQFEAPKNHLKSELQASGLRRSCGLQIRGGKFLVDQLLFFGQEIVGPMSSRKLKFQGWLEIFPRGGNTS